MLIQKPNTMKKSSIKKILLFALVVFLTACGSNKQKTSSNWMSEYDVDVAIDETFQPIMGNLVDTFGMTYKEAKMKPVYVSEDSAIRMLVNDSIRCIIVTRKLNDNELAIIKGHTLGATQAFIATDAIALVVNKQNNDSLISLDEVKGIVNGKITRWEQLAHHTQAGELKLVFDNSRSSTVRYMRDSLCNGNDLKGNVYASEGGTNQSVLEMVKADPSIIGVVGANWLMGDSNTALSDFSKLDINVMRVRGNDATIDEYVRPYQYFLATGEYPLHRSVFVIHTDPRSKSLIRSFFFFLKGQKGQTVICNNSQLLPMTPVFVKDVSIK